MDPFVCVGSMLLLLDCASHGVFVVLMLGSLFSAPLCPPLALTPLRCRPRTPCHCQDCRKLDAPLLVMKGHTMGVKRVKCSPHSQYIFASSS